MESPFQTTGSLPFGHKLYIAREIDEQLLQHILLGKHAAIIGPRQTGKSSLRIRTAQGLENSGIVTTVADMSALGKRGSLPEQLYYNLFYALGKTLELFENAAAYKTAFGELSTEARFAKFADLLNEQKAETFVFFIEEMDAALGILPNPKVVIRFYTDLLKYSSKLSSNSVRWVLVGSGIPEMLIPQQAELFTCPFFSKTECDSLAWPFVTRTPNSKELMNEVFAYTAGQPQLTARMYSHMWSNITPPKSISEWAAQSFEQLFIAQSGLDNDTNLPAVAASIKRFPKFEKKTKALLADLLNDKKTKYNDSDPVQAPLVWSGVAYRKGKLLKIANKIYKQVIQKYYAI